MCQRIPFKIHQGGSNYNFADGHAKWVNGADSRMQWPKGLSASKRPAGTYFWPE